MPNYLLAHDLGTSGNKATLFDTDGNHIKSCVAGYNVSYSNGNWAEQDPDEWWNAVCQSTRVITEGINLRDIAAVSFSGQMMGVVAIDKDGSALRNAIIWADMRSVKQEKALEREIGKEAVYRITGHRLSCSYSLEKLMWIRDMESGIYEKTFKSLCAKDYIITKLTGKYVTDASDASGTNAFNLNTFSWSADILHAADISMDKFPDVLKSTDIAGRVTAKAALECGLLEGTPVVTGGGDGVCASVGAGSIAPGITYNCLGSSSWICTVSEKPLLDDQMRLFNWAHVVPGLIAPCGTMQAAGASFNWAVKEIFKAENIRGLHGNSSYDHINTAIAKSRTGANGLIFLPYLMGERAPRWNPNARGCFIGLKMDTKNEDMLRAVVEGVAMNLKIILSLLTERIEINEMILMGGLARSRVIRSILADVYGMNICKLNLLEEGTSLGAAVTAGVGIGALNGFEDVNKFTQAETEEPYNRKNHQVYQKIQANFNEAYFSLLKVFDNLAAQQLAE